MSDYDGKNIFEKIGSFIPGYKGYLKKEGRRDTDKILRVEMAKHLDRRKNDIDDAIRHQLDQKKLESVGELDLIKRKLGLVADQIRHTDYGYSGFFDIVQVDTADLDRLYQFDLLLKEHVERLDESLRNLASSPKIKEDCLTIMQVLAALSEKIQQRSKVITEAR
jgi:hypothetical protein